MSIPSISYHMLVDALEPCDIISQPAHPPSKFRWAASVHWKSGIVPEKDVLFVCKSKMAEAAAKEHRGCLIVAIANTDTDITRDLSDIENPLIVVKGGEKSDGLLQRLQDYFLTIQSWQNELFQITPSADALRKILSRSARIVGAPLALYGSDSKPVAKALFNANVALSKNYEARESEIVNSVRSIKRSPSFFKGEKVDIIVESATIGSEGADNLLLVAAFEKQPTFGQRDSFGMLVSLLSVRTDLQTGRFDPSRYSAYALLDDLVSGRYISRGQLSDYAMNIGLPLDAEFRFFSFVRENEKSESGLAELARALRAINGGRSVTITYDEHLCLLLYSKGLDSSLANNVVEDQIRPLLKLEDGFVTVSQVFDDITNMGLAYQQTQIVARHKGHIDLAHWFAASAQKERRLFYTFEETLRFALVNPDEMSSELRDFSFSHTILDKIIAEDAANGGNDARILASYIHHERKATVVAEKLHMHRNTVLYRISKIENRFGIDLDESWSRDRLLFDFSILYSKLMHNPKLFKNIVGCSPEDLDLADPSPQQLKGALKQ